MSGGTFKFLFNTLRLRQNGCHFPDDIMKRIFLNVNIWISIKISLKFVPRGPINNIPALVQIMAWRRQGGKPFSVPIMVNLLMHICSTSAQWHGASKHTIWTSGFWQKFLPKLYITCTENCRISEVTQVKIFGYVDVNHVHNSWDLLHTYTLLLYFTEAVSSWWRFPVQCMLVSLMGKCHCIVVYIIGLYQDT